MGIKKKKEESVAIILPCAGHGTRLNAPYPKELTKINEDMSIIDFSFHHILASHVKPRVIVIIAPHKFDTVRYLYEKYNDKVELVFVFEKNGDKNVASTLAVKSAQNLLCDKNILLLPDTIIEYKDKGSLIDKMLDILDHHHFVFAHKNENSLTRLKLFGALDVKEGRVIGYEDKPQRNIKKYNAFWVALGFNKGLFGTVISIIEKCTL